MTSPLSATPSALVLLALSSAPATAQVAAHRGSGDAGGFLNIVGPGQEGVLNGPETLLALGGTYPARVIDQLSMYGDLWRAAFRVEERHRGVGGCGGVPDAAARRPPLHSRVGDVRVAKMNRSSLQPGRSNPPKALP